MTSSLPSPLKSPVATAVLELLVARDEVNVVGAGKLIGRVCACAGSAVPAITTPAITASIQTAKPDRLPCQEFEFIWCSPEKSLEVLPCRGSMPLKSNRLSPGMRL